MPEPLTPPVTYPFRHLPHPLVQAETLTRLVHEFYTEDPKFVEFVRPFNHAPAQFDFKRMLDSMGHDSSQLPRGAHSLGIETWAHSAVAALPAWARWAGRSHWSLAQRQAHWAAAGGVAAVVDKGCARAYCSSHLILLGCVGGIEMGSLV